MTPTPIQSVKSASDTKRQPRLNRTLKRGANVGNIEDNDLRWCFAAQRLGALQDIEGMPEKPSRQEFLDAFIDWLGAYRWVWILRAPCEDEQRPVGIAMGQDLPAPGAMLSGIEWFPWATPRRRVEASVALFNTLRRDSLVMIPVPLSESRFFVHMARYGILRRVGTVHDAGPEPVALFQTRRPGG